MVDWCSYETAKYAVMRWHYSKIMTKSRNNYIGVWEDGQYIGCFIYGFSISPQLGKIFGLEQIEFTELKRIALDNHNVRVSHLISETVKMIKGRNPGLRLVISFADSEQGHIGAVYQASNFVYIGFEMIDKLFSPKASNGASFSLLALS